MFWCPQCGEGMGSDEDGCCTTCGATLIDPDVYGAIRRKGYESGRAAEREACALYLDREADKAAAECAAAHPEMRDPTPLRTDYYREAASELRAARAKVGGSVEPAPGSEGRVMMDIHYTHKRSVYIDIGAVVTVLEMDEAARLLAGLEVAVGQAVEYFGGKCLRCGKRKAPIVGCRCNECGGVLEPVYPTKGG